jgi:hypothetical protein
MMLGRQAPADPFWTVSNDQSDDTHQTPEMDGNQLMAQIPVSRTKRYGVPSSRETASPPGSRELANLVFCRSGCDACRLDFTSIQTPIASRRWRRCYRSVSCFCVGRKTVYLLDAKLAGAFSGP